MSPTETPPDNLASSAGNSTPDQPRVVAIGGGHGLAASLRAIRRYTSNVTAVVSVADDGGSSGRLREMYGVPAPGDIRRCLLALAADDEHRSRIADALAFRFGEGDLSGHVTGNLLLTALHEVTGDFVLAIEAMQRLLGVSGRVLPNAEAPLTLHAETGTGPVVGQVAVKESGDVRSVSVDNPAVKCPAAALTAVGEADQIVLGPGSLFTSVLAAVAVDELREAVNATSADRVYLCNLRPEPAETADFDVARHLDVLADHGVEVDRVIFDPVGIAAGQLRLPASARPLAGANGMVHEAALLADALTEMPR